MQATKQLMNKSYLPLFFFGIFFLQSLFLQAQKEAHVWAFGKECGLDFSTSPPTFFASKFPLTRDPIYRSIDFAEGLSSISDAAGNLRIYSDGIRLYRVVPGTDYKNIANHTLVTNKLKGHSSSAQSGVILPHPAKADVYYVFSLYEGGKAGHGLHYTTYDYKNDVLGSGSLGPGLGYINQQLILNSRSSGVLEALASVRRTDKDGFWVIAFVSTEVSSYRLYTLQAFVYGIDASGLDKTPVITDIYKDIDITLPSNASFRDGGFLPFIFDQEQGAYAKVTTDGSRLSLSVSVSSSLLLLDFDTRSGKVSNPQLLASNTTDNYFGQEFSPNGKLLYVIAGRGDKIYRFDLSAGSLAAIKSSRKLVGAMPTGFLWEDGSAVSYESFEDIGLIQLAPDGNIYIAHEGVVKRPPVARGGYDTTRLPSNYLGIIEHPNDPVKAKYRWRGIPLGFVNPGVTEYDPYISREGLPNFSQSYLASAITYIGACDGSYTFDGGLGGGLVSGISWDFGDPGSGASNRSTLRKPVHRYTREGSYDVKLEYVAGGVLQKVSVRVQVYLQPSVDLGLDRVLPVGGGGITLDGSVLSVGAGLGYKWEELVSGGSGRVLLSRSPSQVLNKVGEYELTVENPLGCVATDVVKVAAPVVLSLDLGVDRLKCVGAVELLDVSSAFRGGVPGVAYSYNWSLNGNPVVLKERSVGVYELDKTGLYELEIVGGGKRVVDALRVDDISLSVDLGLDRSLPAGGLLLDGSALSSGSVSSYVWEEIVGAGVPNRHLSSASSHRFTKAGEYRLVVRSSPPLRCAAADTVKLRAGLSLDLGLDREKCVGAVELLDVGKSFTGRVPGVAYSYNWSLNGKSVVLKERSAGVYELDKAGLYELEIVGGGKRVADAVRVDDISLGVDLGLDRVLPVGGLRLDGSLSISRVKPSTYSYSWEELFSGGGSALVSNKSVETFTKAGRYRLTVRDGLGCVASDALELVSLRVDLGRDTLLCYGASHRLDGGKYLTAAQRLGAKYVWSDGSAGRYLLVSGNKSGVYRVEVEVGGLKVSDAIRVDYAPELKVDLGSDRTICHGSSVRLDGKVSGVSGLVYAWRKDGVLISGALSSDYSATRSGRYEVEVAYGICAATDVVAVKVKEEIRVDLGSRISLCSGTLYSDKLDAGSGLSARQLSLKPTYVWSDGSAGRHLDLQSDKGLVQRYEVEVSVEGCSVREAVDVSYELFSVGNVDTVLCVGDRYRGDAGSGLGAGQRSRAVYRWEDGGVSGLRTFDKSSDLGVKVRVGGCERDGRFRVGYHSLPEVLLRDTSLCYSSGAGVVLRAGKFEGYKWSTGSDLDRISVKESGRYSVDLRYAGGLCSYKAVSDVGENLGPDYELLVRGRRLEVRSLGVRHLPYEYSLTGEIYGSRSVYEDLLPGVYRVWVRDAAGCVSPSRRVALGLEIPKYFTPNGDGVHDRWEVLGLEWYEGSRVLIYDRYGQELFRYVGGDMGWDGTFDGLLQPQTDYWYVIELEGFQGSETLKGHFTLLRD